MPKKDTIEITIDLTKPKEVSFRTTKDELLTIKKIVDRYFEMSKAATHPFPGTADRHDLEMDLAATHANGCPLDFEKLLRFDNFSFIHDVAGINGTLDRETGKLTKFFLPRCSQPSKTSGEGA